MWTNIFKISKYGYSPITLPHLAVFPKILYTDFNFNLDTCLFYRIWSEPERLSINHIKLKVKNYAKELDHDKRNGVECSAGKNKGGKLINKLLTY